MIYIYVFPAIYIVQMTKKEEEEKTTDAGMKQERKKQTGKQGSIKPCEKAARPRLSSSPNSK